MKNKTLTFMMFNFLGTYLIFASFINIFKIEQQNLFVLIWVITYPYFLYLILLNKENIKIKTKNIKYKFSVVYLFFFVIIISMFNNPLGLSMNFEKIIFFLLYTVGSFVIGFIFSDYFNKRVDRNFLLFLFYILFFLGLFEFIIKFNTFLFDETSIRLSGFAGKTGYNLYGKLVFLLIMFYYFQKKQRKTNMYFISIIGIVLIFLTGSRGTIITIVLTFFIYLFITNKKKFFYWSIILIILISSFVLIIETNIGNNTFEETGSINKYIYTYKNVISGNINKVGGERFEIIKEYFNNFKNNPILGTGFSYLKNIRYDPHNSFIEILGQLGLFGLLFFLIIVVIGYIEVRYFLRYGNSLDKIIAITCVCFFIGNLFSGSIFDNFRFWFSLGYLMSRKLD